MPNIGPALKAFKQRAIASPPVISFDCASSPTLRQFIPSPSLASGQQDGRAAPSCAA